jgi:hypothetical protein
MKKREKERGRERGAKEKMGKRGREERKRNMRET